jgi:hypothetical protein
MDRWIRLAIRPVTTVPSDAAAKQLFLCFAEKLS